MNASSFHLVYNAILVAMEQRANEHGMFAYNAFIQNCDNCFQRLSRVCFNIGFCGAVPKQYHS